MGEIYDDNERERDYGFEPSEDWDVPCAACNHIETAHDIENQYGEAVMCWCSCPDFVKREDSEDSNDKNDDEYQFSRESMFCTRHHSCQLEQDRVAYLYEVLIENDRTTLSPEQQDFIRRVEHIQDEWSRR